MFASANYATRPQQFLYFLPLPQGQGALRPGAFAMRASYWHCTAPRAPHRVAGGREPQAAWGAGVGASRTAR